MSIASPTLAIEFQYGARSELEQVANFHMGAAEHRGDLDWHVKNRFEVGGAPVDGFGIRGHERAPIGHDLDVAAVFEVGERYHCVVVTHCCGLQKS